MDHAYRLEETGQIKAATRILSNCSKFAKKNNLVKFYLQSEKYRAFLLIKSNNLEEASLVADHLLSFSDENNSLQGKVYSNRLYAMIEMNKGNVDVSIKKYLETQTLRENTKDSMQIAEGFSDLGLAFFYQKDYKSAAKYFKKTVSYYMLHHKTDYATGPLSNMSTSYIELGEYDEAKKILQFLLPIAMKNNDVGTVVNVYQNLAYLEREAKNLDASIDFTLKALALLENSEDLSRIGSLHLNLGEFYRAKKDYKKAEEYLLSGLKLEQRSNNLLRISRAYNNLSVLYSDLKKFEIALTYKDSFSIINDSIFSVEKQEGIIRLREEQKELRIASLTKDQLLQTSELKKQRNLIYSFIIGAILLFVTVFFIYRNFKIKKEREKKNLELLVQNAELTALKAQMNPHFIFNALNSIQHSIVVNNTEDAYRFLAKFSKLIRNILDNSSQQLVPLTTEMETLSLYVDVESKRFDNSFESKIEIFNKNNYPAEKIMLPPMMLQPFIENAIWHGLMPKEGKKSLNILFDIVSETQVICAITDNGIGREEAKKIARAKKKIHKSKGIENIYERIKLLERTYAYKIDIEMSDNQPEGTKVIVTFKKTNLS
jgi:tetratricopeptide (TPR) repeat protein